MPATNPRCRICETDQPLDGIGTCPSASARSIRSTTSRRCAPRVSRESIEAGPASLWRYADLLPVAAPAQQRLAPGFTPLVAAPRLAEELGIGELYLKLDNANPTHSFKDRVVAVACAKALELGCTTLSCSSTGNLAGAVAARAAAEGIEAAVFVPAGLEPEKLVAASVYGATIYAVRGTYDDVSRLTIELSFELENWGFTNVGLRSYYAEGSKTLAFEIAEQLGWRFPTRGRRADRVRLALHEGAQGLRAVPGARPRRRRPAAPVRRAGGGLLARRRGVRGRRARPAGASRLGLHLARDRLAGRRRPRRRDRARRAAAPSTRSPRRRSASTSASWPRSSGVWGESATGVTFGGLKAAVAAGELGRDDTVVLLVTGDGLKTPQLVAETCEPLEIDADADALLDRLGVAVA